MRHLAICLTAAGPALRVRRSVAVLGAFIVFLLPLVACADSAQGSLWGSWDESAAADNQNLWADFRPETELGATSTGGLFREPVLSESTPAWDTDRRQNSVVRPVQYTTDEWLGGAVPSRARNHEVWCHQVLPDGLIYRSYLAGIKESRFAGQWVHDVNHGWMWDITLGGRVGILRYGTSSADHPEGWQIDIEGAGMPRLDLEQADRDLMAADFRFGVPLTYGRGIYQTKFGYYHLSSHLGDEYMVRHSTLLRRNYSRDVIVWGHSVFLTEDIRLYGEAGWAFAYDGGAEPWEFQFGAEYSPAKLTGHRGAPFVAINAHLRQEFDFGGNLVVQTGWQWRGYSGHLFRIGMHYFQGMSDQWEFYDQYEDKLGFGIWYDF